MIFLRHLRALLWLDLRQAWHGRLVHVCLGIGLVFGLAVRFALPAQLELGDPPQVVDMTEEGRFAGYFAEHGLTEAGVVRDEGPDVNLTDRGRLVYDLATRAFYPESVLQWMQERQDLVGTTVNLRPRAS